MDPNPTNPALTVLIIAFIVSLITTIANKYLVDQDEMNEIQARSKKSLAERFLEDYPDAVPLFVGDTDHDFESAAAINTDCVLFVGGDIKARPDFQSWGFP